jgi:signal transduction histidine kinase
MKSIRRTLTISLLSGLTLLWLLAGAGVYFAVRSGLMKAVDAELAIDAQMLRFVVRADKVEAADSENAGGRFSAARRMQAKTSAYDEPGRGYYYEGWTADGTSVDRSPSLEHYRLPFPENVDGDSTFATIRIGEEVPVRTMSFRVSSGGRGKSKGERRRAENATIISIAHDLRPLENTLSSLLGGITAVGLVAAGGTFLLVGIALRRGLKPLQEIAVRTRDIDATSLDFRFDPSGAPVEMQPIYQRLNDLMGRIENSFERERRFSSDLAHEMRTPVAELKLQSENALKWPDDTEESIHRENFAIAEQLESMIENLLALARWESGAATLQSELVDLESVARTCWEPLAKLAAKKNLAVQFSSGEEDEPSTLETDPGMLRHILTNLFSNAVEYTPPEGEILVSIQPEKVEVRNTADGLDAEQVGHFFDRYWRRDKVRGDSTHTGLGLSLARACADALGLQLTASLDGSDVRFVLEKT